MRAPIAVRRCAWKSKTAFWRRIGFSGKVSQRRDNEPFWFGTDLEMMAPPECRQCRPAGSCTHCRASRPPQAPGGIGGGGELDESSEPEHEHEHDDEVYTALHMLIAMQVGQA